MLQGQPTEVLNIFQNFRMSPTSFDQYEAVGKKVLGDQIGSFMAYNNPIKFVMLGYPMKSPNDRDKVLGKLPDMAEEASFKNFAKFKAEVKKVYEPGVEISVVSDGYVFSDLMKVNDKVVAEYAEAAIDMADGAIKLLDITDLYGKSYPMNYLRHKLMEQFGISDQTLEQRILFDPDVNALYRGMIKFLNLDLAINNYASNTQLQKEAKRLARQMMFRNEAYSHLVMKEFGGHIRLSMHPSANSGKKFSFQLIPGDKAWTSPWHCALYIDEVGEYVTIHRKDAEKAGLRTVYNNGRPYYFEGVKEQFYSNEQKEVLSWN